MSTVTDANLLIFMAADIRGYTRFTLERGDEAAARLADEFAALCEEVVSAHAGQVLELRGDEAFCIFTSARNALRAAVALQERAIAAAESDASLMLNVGIGLDAGEPVPVRGGYRGGALNLAARLCSIAGAGEILASETVIGLARKTEGLAYADRGPATLKGFPAPVKVVQIAREGALPHDLPPIQRILGSQSRRNNLPDQPTPFIGREHEIAELSGLVNDQHTRLVTLTGLGGTGKSRLALRVAGSLLHPFRDGIFWCDLSSLTDATLVASSVASVLGVAEQAARPVEETVVDYLQHRRVLLLLDNFEHLIEAAPLVARLLDACRELRVLVTSRVPLHIMRERVYEVAPLAVPDPTRLPDLETLVQLDSVALFVQCARAAEHEFALSEGNADAVAGICAHLDGLPLAIELAAARTRLLSPAALLNRLSDRLGLLTGGARDAPARHRTLEATIEWSYSLLTPWEKTVFARLAVFKGGCALEAAEATCSEPATGSHDLLAAVTSLVEKSLVTRRVTADGETRIVMLDTIREFASGKLRDSGEADQLRAAHAHYYRSLPTAQVAAEITQEVWFGLLSEERDNLRAAVEWMRERQDMASVLRVGSALHVFWISHGLSSEARAWLNDVCAWSDTLPVSERISVLGAAAEVGGGVGDPRTNGLLEERARLRASLGDPGAAADELNLAARRALSEGDALTGQRLLQQELVMRRQLGEGVPEVLGALAWLALEEGAYVDAADLYGESLELSRSQGDSHAISLWLDHLGHTSLCTGEHADAERYFRQALEIQRLLDDKVCIARSLRGLSRVALEGSDGGAAAHLLEEALVLDRSTGHPRSIAWSLCLLGDVRAATGHREASKLYAESLRLTGTPEDRWVILTCLDGVIRLWIERGRMPAAMRLYGAVEHARRFEPIYLGAPIRDSIGGYLGKAYRTGQEARIDLQSRLGTTRTRIDRSAGEDMTLEQAVSFALRQLEL